MHQLYFWILQSWFGQGEKWVLTRLKSICDWALYYAVESNLDRPALLPGTIGGTRDGWLTFPWSRGEMSRRLFPTVGPYKSLDADEKSAFHLYELYGAKGALPVPSREMINDSLIKHRKLLSSGGVTDGKILAAARAYAQAYAKRFPPQPKNFQTTVSSSACTEVTLGAGGRAHYLVEIFKGQPPLRDDWFLFQQLFNVWGDKPQTFVEQQESHVVGLCSDILFRLGGMPQVDLKDLTFKSPYGPYTSLYIRAPKIFHEDFKAPLYGVKAEPVLEQGAKARIITVAPGPLITLLQCVREWTFSSLSKDKDIGPLTGEGTLTSFMKEANKFLSNPPPRFNLRSFLRWAEILSVDLTNATDTLFLDICQALMEGFLSGCDSVPTRVSAVWKYATCPVKVVYPPHTGIQELESSSRGVEMGNPTSMFILNILNRFIYDLSRILVRYFGCPVLGDPGPFLDQLNEFKVVIEPLVNSLKNQCGDDLIALNGNWESRTYENLITRCGGIISPGVHFSSKSFGIYTKQLCTLKGTEFKFIDILRPRTLRTPDSRLPGRKENPQLWSRGSSAFNETLWWPDGDIYRSAITYLHWTYKEFINTLRGLKMEVYLPFTLGGWNFPHFRRKVPIFSNKSKRMISILLRRGENLDELRDLERLSIFKMEMTSEVSKLIEPFIDRFLDNFRKGDEKSDDSDYWWKPITSLGELKAPPFTASYKDFFKFKEALEKQGLITFEDAIAGLKGRLLSSLSRFFDSPSLVGAPKLKTLSKRFNSLRDSIISRDPYWGYKELTIRSRDDLEVVIRGLKWKLNSIVFLKANFEFLLDREINDFLKETYFDLISDQKGVVLLPYEVIRRGRAKDYESKPVAPEKFKYFSCPHMVGVAKKVPVRKLRRTLLPGTLGLDAPQRK